MNEIVQFEDFRGTQITITPNDVRNVLCPQANDKEIYMFLELCRVQQLNPFIKDAYLVKYGSAPAMTITGKEVFTKRANANPAYQGFEAGVTFIDGAGKVSQREGSAVYAEAGEKLVGGWCRVFVEGRKPFYDEVTISEYSTGKSGWAKMPATMIRKVALVHCLREAFPKDFQGLYAAEEMGKAGERAGIMGATPEPAPVEMANDAQYTNLNDLVDDLSELRGVPVEDVREAVYRSATMSTLKAVEGQPLTHEQAEAAARLLERWVSQAEAVAVVDATIEATPEPEPEPAPPVTVLDFTAGGEVV